MPSFSRDNWHYRHLMLPHLCEWAEIHIHHWPIPMHQMCFFASTLNHGTYAAYGFRHAFWSHSGNQIAISAAYKCFQTNVLRQHYCRKWTNSSFCVCVWILPQIFCASSSALRIEMTKKLCTFNYCLFEQNMLYLRYYRPFYSKCHFTGTIKQRSNRIISLIFRCHLLNTFMQK